METIKNYIVEYLEREYALPKDIDIDTFNFVDEGYVDSMAMVQFIVLLEDEFGVAFSDDELMDPNFRTVGGLAGIVAQKQAENA